MPPFIIYLLQYIYGLYNAPTSVIGLYFVHSKELANENN